MEISNTEGHKRQGKKMKRFLRYDTEYRIKNKQTKRERKYEEMGELKLIRPKRNTRKVTGRGGRKGRGSNRGE